MQQIEKFLATLSSDQDDELIELVQVSKPDQTPTLELRVRPRDEAFGQMTMRRMQLAPGQISQLRDALNLMDLDAQQAKSPRRVVAEEKNHLKLIG